MRQCKGWNTVLLVLLGLGAVAQKLPTRDEGLFQMQIRDKTLFHDSSVIPDGAEISGYLFRDTAKRYYFVVEEDNTPLSVTVTPCDAPLEWKLTLQELPEEASGEGSGEPEPLDQQKQQVTADEGTELFTYKGNDVESYVATSTPSGLYQLELLSTEKDSNFKVYATTTPESDQPYPELPYDPRVDVTALGRTTVTLAWKPTPTGSLMGQPVQYCVVINKEHNFKSMCAAEAKMSTDDAFMLAPKPGRDFSPFDFMHFGFVPPDSGFGKDRGLTSNKISRAYTAKPKTSDIQKVCIGNKNIFTVSDLKPDTQYYFDVFAVNSATNTSTAYVGTFARTKEEARQKTVELKDGKVSDVFIKRKGSKFLRFAPVSSHQRVTLFVHTCLDAVQVQVRRDGKLLLSQNVEGVRQFQLRGKPKAKYLIRLRGSRKGASTLKVLATTRPSSKQPFPSLPEDTRIKAFDKLRTCSSVTVAWLGTQDRNKYCIYRKEVADNYGEEQRRREQNQCAGPETRRKSEKVLCKYFHSPNLQKAVTTETITGLEQGKTYLLDVYVVGHSGHSVKYQSKLVKTRKYC
ncbi:protein NDNF [Toxotes jaculatrix]|uniref:protein NDNF n=1 Tax=Toxotes jaculatrix TaxID=941984 RepID=UPI001B3ABF9E|nr:protein NDNF [Toxotes jaculatrix]